MIDQEKLKTSIQLLGSMRQRIEYLKVDFKNEIGSKNISDELTNLNFSYLEKTLDLLESYAKEARRSDSIKGFENELCALIKKYMFDVETGAKDFIIARHVAGCIENLKRTLKAGEHYRKIGGDK